MKIANVVVLVIVILAAAGLSYQIGASQFKGELNSKEKKIASLEKSIEDVKAQAQKETRVSPVTAAAAEEVNCLACHDVDQTKGFHVPQTIMKIDEKEGKRRRVCVDCHGPLGPPWSADEQLTPLNELIYNASHGTNGVIEIDSTIPHAIHKQKLDSGAVECEDCHGEGPDIKIPEPLADAGQVLVCQNCKTHPEGGNYITIHLEIAGKKCTTCHTGGIVEVHKAKTSKLGQV